MAIKYARWAIAIAILAGTAACGASPRPERIPTGTDVRVQTHDSDTIAGRLIEVRPESIVILDSRAVTRAIARSEVKTIVAVAKSGPSRYEAATGPTSASGTSYDYPATGTAGRDPAPDLVDQGFPLSGTGASPRPDSGDTRELTGPRRQRP